MGGNKKNYQSYDTDHQRKLGRQLKDLAQIGGELAKLAKDNKKSKSSI